MPDTPSDRSTVEIDALFALECGCIMDGCSGSHPGRAWAAGVRNGVLYCTKRGRLGPHGRQTLVDVVSLSPLTPLPEPQPDE